MRLRAAKGNWNGRWHNTALLPCSTCDFWQNIWSEMQQSVLGLNRTHIGPSTQELSENPLHSGSGSFIMPWARSALAGNMQEMSGKDDSTNL